MRINVEQEHYLELVATAEAMLKTAAEHDHVIAHAEGKPGPLHKKLTHIVPLARKDLDDAMRAGGDNA